MSEEERRGGYLVVVGINLAGGSGNFGSPLGFLSRGRSSNARLHHCERHILPASRSLRLTQRRLSRFLHRFSRKKSPKHNHIMIMFETNHSSAVPLNLTFWSSFRIPTYTPPDNGCGRRQSILISSGLPSKVHSAANAIPQSHHLRLSVIPFPEAYSSFSTV